MTWSIIGINILVHLVFGVGQLGGERYAAIAFGHIPTVALDAQLTLPLDYQVIPDGIYWLTAITAAFIHADWFHLGGNMLFLWVFGDNVEDAMGHIKFLLFYLACAFAASFFHALNFPASDAPLIGASGAAAGVIAAYLMLHPKMKIWVLFAGRIPLYLPAYLLLTGWIGLQVFNYFFDSGSNVSWAAHVGGIVAGIVLVGLLKRREVPLFDREIVIPDAIALKPNADLPPEVKAPAWGRDTTLDSRR